MIQQPEKNIIKGVCALFAAHGFKNDKYADIKKDLMLIMSELLAKEREKVEKKYKLALKELAFHGCMKKEEECLYKAGCEQCWDKDIEDTLSKK